MDNAYNYNIEIIRVIDGDSLVADVDLGLGVWLRDQYIRLWGIECPPTRTRNDEIKDLGYDSKEYLEGMISQTEGIYSIKSYGRGKYGRIIATVFQGLACDENMRWNICEEMLKSGHAVPYESGKKTHKWL